MRADVPETFLDDANAIHGATKPEAAWRGMSSARASSW